MVVERRVYNRLPCYLQTDQNNRSTYIADDVLFEPERAAFLSGYIGDTSILTEKDLERLPPIAEGTAERQKYQLSLGAVLIDPDTDERSGGVFYTDLVRQIDANGGITDDPNRLFETPFYAWTPPVDYDKHINFSRYYWTGAGNAEVNGEYITKEAQGSQTVMFEVTSTGFVSRMATISATEPTSPATGDLWEDVSSLNRIMFRYDGVSWVGVPFFVRDVLPETTDEFGNGDFVYVTRSNPDFSRPLVWKYSLESGRWISLPVVVGPLPDSPTEGMIWEDASLSPTRSFRIYRDGLFVPLQWTSTTGPSGTPSVETYLYDTRNITNITDGWSQNNFWRHFNDLAPADREALQAGDQATRPLLEFWAGIEIGSGDARDNRNDTPVFTVYRYDIATDSIVAAGASSTIFQYQVGTGVPDPVLNFPLVFNQTGEFQFELTLETDAIEGATGYRYFVDGFTGLAHSIWSKSTSLTVQEIDADGLAEVPRNITSNSDHEVLTIASRSRMLPHMAGNVSTQTGFEGNQFGLNNYRWTNKATTNGSTIIDCENSLLRTLATLQRPELSIPDVIRRVSRDYNRVISKFTNRLDRVWDNLTISDPTGVLTVTPAEAVNAILTELFVGRGKDFSYANSDMGTYEEVQILAGMVSTVGTEPRPIFIPPSAARTGSAPAYKPSRFVDRDGRSRLRGHDGTVVNAYGDGRDDVWLELQTRFFNAVPTYYRDEIATFSSRHTGSNFVLVDYYGNSKPVSTLTVTGVVADFNAIPSPIGGQVYYDTGRGQFAYYDGAKFLTADPLVDDIFTDGSTGKLYIFNGFQANIVELFNRNFSFDYSNEEFRQIMRREFERWAVGQDVDFVTNVDFDENDPFTWNYRSAGIEGHYLGIYTRLYRTVRPHSHPWEIVGYTVEPEWWRTSYVPTDTAADGTPRYGVGHPMWADIQNGIYNPLTGLSSPAYTMTAPIPVDGSGELLDPVAAGIVNIDLLLADRRDDGWIYGDGAPVEQAFIGSTAYAFGLSLLGYLMKPGLFVDTVWSELYIDVGQNGSVKLWNAPHVVHADTLTRPQVNDLPVHLEETNGVVERRLGINAWISEYVRILGQSVSSVFGDTIRNTSISVGWKTSGFINEERTKIQTLSGINIPFEDVHTILHRSPPFSERFGSGVLVAREGTGYRVFGFDLFDPFFEIDLPIVPITGGQTELREEFTATDDQHSFATSQFNLPRNTQDNDTAKLSVLVNGLRLKPQHVTVINNNTFEIESIVGINAGDQVIAVVLTTQSNASTRVKQFSVEGVPFPYIDAGQGITQRIEYGRFFESSTDVINFMLAYGRKLTADGWVFDELIDQGEIRDWLYGAKQLASWVLDVSSPWQPNGPSTDTEFFFSPFNRSAKFSSEFGQVLNVEALQNGAYGILDKDANPIDPETVFTSRIGNELTLTPDAGAEDIFGIRVLVAEDQHVVFLSNVTKFNDLIYDPVISLFQSTLRVDAYRSLGWAGRLEADGFVINQGELLPNFEKQAKDFTRFYDRFDTLDDPVKRDQARELYGWYPNGEYVSPTGDATPMMDAIGADDRARFDYHRGMVHTKGSVRPLIAFSRGTCVGRDNVLVNEDWAWRWCEFGDTRRELVQFRVGKSDYRDTIQVIEFSDGTTVNSGNTLVVEPFNRATPNEGRWIIPPTTVDATGNYTLPIRDTGFFDRGEIRVSASLFDTDTNLAVVDMFHYDPDNFLFDPTVTCELSNFGASDPARYTDGPGAVYSDGIQWGPEEVGRYWWDTRRLGFTNYRGLLPDYDLASREWGKLTYFNATINRVSEIATVETLDPYTKLPSNHNLETGDEVVITGAVPDEYNGTYTITVATDTTFEFEVNDLLDFPATGDIIVQTKFFDICEWIESPVLPSGWVAYTEGLNEVGSPTGTPIDGDDTSYVTEVVTDARGVRKTLYYFWVVGNTGENPNNDLSAEDLRTRLLNPTRTNSPWFAIVDETHMLTFVGGERVQDDYAIEFIQDRTELDFHTEWLLISEGDQFKEVPDIIRNKLIDCLAGVDMLGNAVPSPMLSDTEKFGTAEFPIQTVFVDRSEAIKVTVAAINAILNHKDLNTVSTIAGQFPITDENTYWVRSEYRNPVYEDTAVFATVATEAVRADRLSRKLFFTNDLVKVVQSGNTDLWTGDVTDSTYVLDADGNFIEVGVNNHTLNVILDENTTADIIRSTFNKVYELLTKEEQNSLIFTLLYEMMRQTPNADWFMKTSYITMQIFDTVSQSPFIRPNEVEAIIANAIDLKPYRTKLRSSTFTYTIDQIEDMGVRIDEFPDQKITLRFDRLNCALEDEAGWDIFAWDTEVFGWDRPLWDYNDLGREEFLSIGTITAATGQTQFVFPSPYDPTLYAQRVIVTDAGAEINPADIGLTFSVAISHADVTVMLSAPLGPSFTVEVQQSIGFYQGNAPTLGSQFDDTLFQAFPSTYRHHVPRMMDTGVQAPFPSMEACYEDPPRSPDERIANDVEDSVVICVRTDYTGAYAGWDTTPWDSTRWDQPPNDIGPRVFYIMAGKENIIPAGLGVFATSETTTVTSERFLAASEPHDIVRVDIRGVEAVEGVDYRFLPEAPWVIEFIRRDDVFITADGATTTFDVAGLDLIRVFKNGVEQFDGVNYQSIGTDIVFEQPLPTVVPLRAYTRGRHNVGDGMTPTFNTGIPADSLDRQNVLLFVDGLLQPTSAYDIDSNANVVLNTPPADDASIITFTLGNDVADDNDVFAENFFTGDGTTTTFAVGNNHNDITGWVFVDGVYQIRGTDYSVTVYGTIEFATAPANGTSIVTRTMRPSEFVSYDQEHITFTASGNATDPIPGINDAEPDQVVIFVGNDLQNSYSPFDTDFVFVNGQPDEIQWDNPPAAGTPITVRVLRSITLTESTLINVEPVAGDVIRIVRNGVVNTGDSVSFYYNKFPVGPLGDFAVNSVPTTYDVSGGFMYLDNPVLNGFIDLAYSTERRAPNPTSILVRMANVTDIALVDHLDFEEDNRRTGLRVLNTTTDILYEWDGNDWINTGVTFVATDQVLSLLDQQIIEFDGTDWNVVFNTGDTFGSPPVLQYPSYGIGIASGGYSLGQTADAATDFPAAYQVNQNAGEC